MKATIQKQVNSLIADGTITFIEKAQWGSLYSIKGINAKKIRLFISDDGDQWRLAGYDKRGLWFSLGDRADLSNGMNVSTSSFMQSIPALSMGYKSGAAWLKAEILTQI
jgi:hypothetical protein